MNTMYLEAVTGSMSDNADGVERTERGWWPAASFRRVVQFSETKFCKMESMTQRAGKPDGHVKFNLNAKRMARMHGLRQTSCGPAPPPLLQIALIGVSPTCEILISVRSLIHGLGLTLPQRLQIQSLFGIRIYGSTLFPTAARDAHQDV